MMYAITMCFIVLDFVTGMIKAFATNAFTSTKMREGLFHKAGSILVILLGVLVDQAEVVLDLGFAFPVAGAACGYIIMMEIASALENACEINPDLMPDKLNGIFGTNRKREGGTDDAY